MKEGSVSKRGNAGGEKEEKEEKSGEKKRRCQSLLLRRSCPARARTRPLVPLEEEGCIGGRSEEGEKKKRKRSKRKVTAVRSEPSSGTLRKRAKSVHAHSDACRTTWLSRDIFTRNPCLNIIESSLSNCRVALDRRNTTLREISCRINHTNGSTEKHCAIVILWRDDPREDRFALLYAHGLKVIDMNCDDCMWMKIRRLVAWITAVLLISRLYQDEDGVAGELSLLYTSVSRDSMLYNFISFLR